MELVCNQLDNLRNNDNYSNRQNNKIHLLDIYHSNLLQVQESYYHNIRCIYYHFHFLIHYIFYISYNIVYIYHFRKNIHQGIPKSIQHNYYLLYNFLLHNKVHQHCMKCKDHIAHYLIRMPCIYLDIYLLFFLLHHCNNILQVLI